MTTHSPGRILAIVGGICPPILGLVLGSTWDYLRLELEV